MIYNLKRNFLLRNMHIDSILLFFIISLLIYSVFILWSANGQDINMMKRKVLQIFLGFIIMIFLSKVSPRIYELWAPQLYYLCIILLILVIIFGHVSKGAQRWLDLGIFRFQPSEIVKISVPLMVARFINQTEYPPSLKNIIISLILVFIPSYLIAIQPDLGTSIIVIASGLFVLFLSGINWKFIIVSILLILSLFPILWFYFMHDYQKNRLIVFLNPENDPLGAGYHIIQSKISIGSGGLTGKGWLKGTQSQLEFLPERHTDFIFSVIGEELGLIGILLLIFLYLGIIVRGLIISYKIKNSFGKIVSGSLTIILFFCMFINISMVSGILPIVGIPLPLISYGGSSLVALMASFGIVMSMNSYRRQEI